MFRSSSRLAVVFGSAISRYENMYRHYFTEITTDTLQEITSTEFSKTQIDINCISC